jgi:hypothetical protein
MKRNIKTKLNSMTKSQISQLFTLMRGETQKYSKDKMVYLLLKPLFQKYSMERNERNERNIVNNMVDIYQMVGEIYGNDNVYLTGSMAIYFIAYWFGILDENSNYPKPNDVDLIVYTNEEMVYQQEIGGYVRVQQTPERSVTFRSEHSNGFSNFDIIARNREIMRYYDISFNGVNIRLLPLDIIRNEYLDEDRNSSKNDQQKLEMISLLLNQNINNIEQSVRRPSLFNNDGGRQLFF